jgi:hypothetical protein
MRQLPIIQLEVEYRGRATHAGEGTIEGEHRQWAGKVKFEYEFDGLTETAECAIQACDQAFNDEITKLKKGTRLIVSGWARADFQEGVRLVPTEITVAKPAAANAA